MRQLTEEQLQAIWNRAENASPGPWFWRGNLTNKDVRLSYHRPGHGETMVMDFIRWGNQDGLPRFGIEHVMRDADKLAIFEVCPECTDANDERVYRQNIVGFRHPDAEFIAASRQDVQDLLEHIAYLEQELKECELDVRGP